MTTDRMDGPGSSVDTLLRLVTVTAEPLDRALFEAAVADPGAGGVVVFCGVVRDHDHGRTVRELEYLAHPTAQAVLQAIAARFAADHQVRTLAVGHATGSLAVGDTALVAAVATAHRAAAFTICARLVDAVKAELPVWKRQVFTDGSDEWVDCP